MPTLAGNLTVIASHEFNTHNETTLLCPTCSSLFYLLYYCSVLGLDFFFGLVQLLQTMMVILVMLSSN